MEIWKRWIPMEGIPEKLDFESFVDSEKKGLFITLYDKANKKEILVGFEGLVLSYRSTDKDSILQTTKFLSEHYDNEFYTKWSLFTVENSEYTRWFLRESSGIYEKKEVTHYVFLTPNKIIEVLSSYAPEIVVKYISSERGNLASAAKRNRK